MAESAPKPERVLVVYDSLALGTPRQGNVESLERLLAAYGVQVTVCSTDDYKPGMLGGYAKAIGVGNLADASLVNPVYARDLAAYEGDYLHIGEHPPERVMKALQLRLLRTGRQSIRLSSGSYAQTMGVSGIPTIDRAAGTAYGTVSRDDGQPDSPYAVSDGHVAYVSYLEKGNLSEIAPASLLKDWLGVKAEGHPYLLFKEIYPFSDLDLLTHMSDTLYEAGIPFLVSVQPVFDNVDYPAMKRYMAALQYVQAKNGSILVNAPVVASSIDTSDAALTVKMSTFIDALARNGVVALGLGAGLYWSYDRLYAEEGMKFFDSTVLFDTAERPYRSRSDTSLAFASSLYSLTGEQFGAFEPTDKIVTDWPMNAALTYDFPEDEQELDRIIRQAEESWLNFADYKAEPHGVRTAANTLASRDGTLYANGRAVSLNDALRQVSSDYAYKPQEKQQFRKFFDIQNAFFIATITATLFLFGIFFIIGSRRYRRKFYK